jgi:hypothetical protein
VVLGTGRRARICVLLGLQGLSPSGVHRHPQRPQSPARTHEAGGRALQRPGRRAALSALPEHVLDKERRGGGLQRTRRGLRRANWESTHCLAQVAAYLARAGDLHGARTLVQRAELGLKSQNFERSPEFYGRAAGWIGAVFTLLGQDTDWLQRSRDKVSGGHWLAGETLRSGDRDPLDRLLTGSERQEFGTLNYVVALCIELGQPELAWELRHHFKGLSLRPAEDHLLAAMADKIGPLALEAYLAPMLEQAKGVAGGAMALARWSRFDVAAVSERLPEFLSNLDVSGLDARYGLPDFLASMAEICGRLGALDSLEPAARSCPRQRTTLVRSLALDQEERLRLRQQLVEELAQAKVLVDQHLSVLRGSAELGPPLRALESES